MKCVSSLKMVSVMALATALLIAPGAAAATLVAENVDAEAAALDDAGSDSTGLVEIVVTATKRETNLQDTPIAIAVMSEEDLKKRQVQSLLDLADGGIPSLRVATFESRQTALTVGMRGIVPGDANQPARDRALVSILMVCISAASMA